MQTNPADEQNKSIKWSKCPFNQFGRKGKKVLWYVILKYTIVMSQ